MNIENIKKFDSKIKCNCAICQRYEPYSEKWVKISLWLANRKNKKR